MTYKHIFKCPNCGNLQSFTGLWKLNINFKLDTICDNCQTRQSMNFIKNKRVEALKN